MCNPIKYLNDRHLSADRAFSNHFDVIREHEYTVARNVAISSSCFITLNVRYNYTTLSTCTRRNGRRVIFTRVHVVISKSNTSEYTAVTFRENGRTFT